MLVVTGARDLARRAPVATISACALAVIVLAATLAPWLSPFGPLELHRADRLSSPSATYWLGTDTSGRDQFSRLLHGGRVSLWVGVAPILVGLVLGGGWGVLSAYFGGAVDTTSQRVMDAFMAFPPLVLVLVVASLLGSTQTDVIIALSFVFLPTLNRVARASTLQVLSLPYIESARATGASDVRIVVVHILPNVVGPVLVVATSLVGTAILAEAGLSFLGFGVQPPNPSWGNMLAGDSRDVFEIAPWLAIFPGLAITATVLTFNMLGDSVRDLLDPRFRTLTKSGGRLPA